MNISANQNDKTIFVSVAVGSVLFFSFLCLAIYYIQQTNLEHAWHDRTDRFMKTLQQEVADEASRMELLSTVYLLDNPKLKAAMRLRNRQQLLVDSQLDFERIKELFGITHMYFHDTQGVNILRVHQPARYGDVITRVTMQEAMKKGIFNYGYELGPLGTLTLRVVTPWYDGIGLIGYVELGKELELVVNKIAENENVNILMAIDKTQLNKQSYELSMKNKHIDSLWNEYSNFVMLNGKAAASVEIHDAIESVDLKQHGGSADVIKKGERYFSVSAVPIVAAGGQQIGDYYILTDISSEIISNYKILVATLLIGLLITIIFLSLFKSRLMILRKQSHVLLQSIHSTGESILIVDEHGQIEYTNPAFTHLTGYAADEVIGHSLKSLKAEHGNNDFYNTLKRSIKLQELWDGKITGAKKDGRIYSAKLTISPLYDESGSERVLSHYVAIQSDLTEIESLEQQFHQSQKMEAIGTLVGGIAHDFNNMLAGITGNLHLAQQAVSNDPKVGQRLANIETLSMRAAAMIQQLLTFARKGNVSLESMDISAFMNETFGLLETSMPESIRLEYSASDDALMIHGDQTQLHQVLLNLIGNARDALDGVTKDPCIHIALECTYIGDTGEQKFVGAKPGFFAHMSVQDNGSGIPADLLENLFEPFYTTKEQGKGTGLGLAMVFGAVKTHQGFVDVESIEGEGSVFHLYIPLLDQDKDSEDEDEDDSVVFEKGCGEVILLVDDEKHIIETGKVVLESLGYQVIVASNGEEAVHRFKRYGRDIDLCILDVVMPHMGGGDAAIAMRAIQPDVKIIFATGYDKNLLTDLNNEIIISKPFTVNAISRLIKETLEG